ncbi:N-acetylmannosamine-6-phosphate 2-epimerase [Clostridium sp. Marseille-P3244]|uniref:N-acetylmannosamine-6-phosphate 2-epimerase n=1 Tax=Clostridium sp. Marseille-P3244 TaxID=1871020 RepID=UPI0009302C89|nr:N-acetylmannosamine-6-phosphate 2-epimerase [Clostridium sp. Marseille-P3244]
MRKQDNKTILQHLQGRLIVSCQALDFEPLHSSFIMSRMAYAAELGGAGGIRANTVPDIQAIKKETSLPIIGIIKKDYPDTDVVITTTEREVDALAEEGVDIIAMDATFRTRHDGETLEHLFQRVREKYPRQLFMADCSTYEEGVNAENLGFDIVSTTLCGYTDYTQGRELPDYQTVEKFVKELHCPVIAEGGIWTPEQLRKIMDFGVLAVVIGTAITRPMEITRHFVSALDMTE